MFMNRVHEQCPKILTQENTESNRAKNRPSAPSAQPKARPHAQVARPGRAQPALPRALRPCPHLQLHPTARAYPASACRARHARLRVRPCPCACQRPRACRPPATRPRAHLRPRPRAHARPPERSARAQRLPSACTPNSLAQRPAQLPSLAIYLGSSPKFNFSAQKFFSL